MESFIKLYHSIRGVEEPCPVEWKNDEFKAHALQLTKFPDAIFEEDILGRGQLYQSGRVLDLSYNKLTKLPYSIGRFDSLNQLDLSYNKMTKLPDSIGHLRELEILNLSRNKLKTIPNSIGDLPVLATLELFHNKLTSLPGTLANIPTLSTLWVDSIGGKPETHIKQDHDDVTRFLTEMFQRPIEKTEEQSVKRVMPGYN